jgi:hypothetical protein
MCAAGMKAAGLEGPYFSVTRTFNMACIMRLGIGVKGGGIVAGNVVAKKISEVVARAGAGARIMGIVGRGVAIFSSPISAGASIGASLGPLVEHCEIKPAQICEPK